MLTVPEYNRLAECYPVLAELPPSLRLALLNSGSLFHAEPATELFDFSTLSESYVMVIAGTIRVARQGKGREIVLYRVRPGEYCILTVCNILGETLYPTVSTAETLVLAVAIPASLFKQLIEQCPTFNLFIFRSFASRLSGLLGLIDDISFLKLNERLAGLLISRGSVVTTTHAQLADELGSVREVISRILKDFELKGLVKLDRSQVEIVDQAALAAIASAV